MWPLRVHVRAHFAGKELSVLLVGIPDHSCRYKLKLAAFTIGTTVRLVQSLNVGPGVAALRRCSPREWVFVPSHLRCMLEEAARGWDRLAGAERVVLVPFELLLDGRPEQLYSLLLHLKGVVALELVSLLVQLLLVEVV